jgi:two-component sensor histidine kinase
VENVPNQKSERPEEDLRRESFARRHAPLLYSIAAGLAVWVFDAVADALVFYEGPFIDLLILDPPPHELYIRTVILAIFIAFGIAMDRLFALDRHRRHALRLLADDRQELLRELHHRVKNNLQVISGLIELQMLETPEPRFRDVLRRLKGRTDSIALIHDQVCQQDSAQSVDLATWLEALVLRLEPLTTSTGQAVDLTHRAEAVRLPIGRAVAVGLLVNEAVSNAIKHAFNGRPDAQIRVDLQKSGDNSSFLLTIADNGVGFAGESPVDTPGLGMQLMQSLARQAGGELAVTGDDGVRVRLDAPLEGKT